MFPDAGNRNGNDAEERELVGVTACAAAVGLSKGTISKYADGGKIPVAERTKSGAPLFVVEDVRRALPDNVNENMRRDPAADVDGDLADDERRSPDARPSLKSVMIEERQTRTRGLQLRQAQDEGLLVSAEDVAHEMTTTARGTRDAVEQHVADAAGRAYAFAGQPRVEGEWRIFLIGIVREAFAERERALAQEAEESDDDDLDLGGDSAVGPAPQPAGSA